MIQSIRNNYLKSFSEMKYERMLQGIGSKYNHTPPFRIAECPVFIPSDLKSKLFQACSEISNVICQPDFKELTKNAIRHPSLIVPDEDYHTRFLQMDFGVCIDENGELFPQLIEIQGFPSLYFFQDLLSKAYKHYFNIPEEYYVYLDGLHSESYIALLRKIIVGDNDPKNVILLEIEPEKQMTYIDFLGAADHLGIKILCLSQLKTSGRNVYYENENGEKVDVYKIYNRVIFDELTQHQSLKREFYFTEDYDVEWIGHPNWFYRISKYTLPLLKSQYVPDSFYLDQLDQYPENLNDYVLKPLYSFAGAGVSLNVTKDQLDKIGDRDNFILQKKVKYEPVVKTPNLPAKCEIRMLMLWEKGHTSSKIVNNLVRLSKGEMVGVRYNRDKDWVGASVGYFHND